MIEVVPLSAQMISVTEVLPEIGERVFVETASVGHVTHRSIGHWDGTRWICPMLPADVTVIKWEPTQSGGKTEEVPTSNPAACRECRDQKRNIYADDNGQWINACETCQYREET